MYKKKKNLIIVVVILLIIVLILTYLLVQKYVLKNSFEKQILSFANKNDKTVFQINKIILFSNCDAKNKASSSSNFTIENLYQYTDIAIFINHSSTEEKTLENTLKQVSIRNINYTLSPELGQPNLYFKGIQQFAKSSFIEENIIQDCLDFNITSDENADLNTPVLYNNLANPITLSYVNQNIKPDYTLTDTSSPIAYDGSLLKKCNVSLSSIACHISFDIYITNNLEEEFKSTIYIDIPLETSEKTIYDGTIRITQDTNFVFYQYK